MAPVVQPGEGDLQCVCRAPTPVKRQVRQRAVLAGTSRHYASWISCVSGEVRPAMHARSIKKRPSAGTPRMTRRFSRPIVAAIDESKILGVRAGARSDHRFIGIWVVVVDGRVFARSWTQKPDGWYRTFLEDPLGTIQAGKRLIRIRVVRARGDRIREAIERAYAEKYPTPGAAKYVRGFRTLRRRDTTLEFLPR